MIAAPSSKASGYPAGFISLMNGSGMFIYATVRLSEDASGSRFMSNNLMLADNSMFLASLEASAAMAPDDVFLRVYDLLILIICCVSWCDGEALGKHHSSI